jgi:hypothetical protein
VLLLLLQALSPEGVHCPAQVASPALLLQGQPLTQRRLVNLQQDVCSRTKSAEASSE